MTDQTVSIETIRVDGRAMTPPAPSAQTEQVIAAVTALERALTPDPAQQCELWLRRPDGRIVSLRIAAT